MKLYKTVTETVTTYAFIGFMVLSCFPFGSKAQVLPLEEVQALQTIGAKLNISNWNVNQDSCNKPEWRTQINITCDCQFDSGTVCHVTIFNIKRFNLTGVVPDELANLTYVQEIDLSRSYLNGTIPKSLGRLPNLKIVSLLANRISGSIPQEIGNISTLQQLNLEDNLLGGSLPRSIGDLRNLKTLLLSANNFTGEIPDTFRNLKNLTDFRIDGSQLSGKIPEFIGNWTALTTLELQGTSMSGPIPPTISLLTNLTELSITDLNGTVTSNFPDLQGMTRMKMLVLRNCSITGLIPPYLSQMTSLKQLDLSFNMLTGEIPSSLESLTTLQYTFLSHNALTGDVPSWIQNSREKFDLSYNNFTSSIQSSCQLPDINLVASHSSTGSNTISWCLKKDLTCSGKPQYHSLFINAGGQRLSFDDNEYEDDLNNRGPSTFASVSEKWAYSSTGLYMDADNADFLAGNTYGLNVTGGEIYQTARVAPQSLKYYGLCLLRGFYKVRLHFAEIMYTEGPNFGSLGRRLFDVSIQGNVVLTDFNIMEEAGGVGIGIYRDFDNISVNGTTLEIHLYWTGKGTTAVPHRGVYGPLISAITVTPKFKVGGLSAAAIAGIVVASVVVVLLLILLVLRMTGYIGKKEDDGNHELRGLDLQTGYFTLKQIKHATNNFDSTNKIGEGGFGPVYKGVLSDGGLIAVKQLSSKSKQGNREFLNEIGMISAVQHPNLVRLFGCCIEGKELLLVYEYLENNSLARALFGPVEHRIELDWSRRKKILMGIAKGLAYLHEESRLKIVHRDIKATNVLLDKDLNAKISDFGLAKLDEEENTHISTRIAGTIGYMAPEYAMRGYLTDKADVYSFGIVVLEIVSGKSNTNYRPKEEFVYLLDWAYVLQEQGDLLELVDPSLGSHYSKDEAKRILNLALMCTNPSPTLRPTMSSVVGMLEGKIKVQAPIVQHGSKSQDARFKAFEILSQDSQTHASWSSSQEHQKRNSMAMEGPWIDSSVSGPSIGESREHSSSSKLLADL